MLSWLGRIMWTCWMPVRRYARMNKDDDNLDDPSIEDPLFWSRELEKHVFGDFSFAVVQANAVLEDQSQVEIGREATFVGVYDGHGGPDAARYISDHLFPHLMRHAQEKGTLSEDVLRSAFSATEDGFLTLVRRSCGIKPVIAAEGSCCLVGVIWRGTLYVANVGDSRAVIGSLGRSNKIVAEQLSREHNAGIEEVRQELKALHPNDSEIVVMKNGAWRIKGIIQVSRSIGDAYLKRPEFSLDSSFPRFQLPEPLGRPVLSAEPSVCTRNLQPEDRFIIFASDGLWELITNQEAVEIVHNSPREGIAKRLMKVCMSEAGRRSHRTYDYLKKVERGERRSYHDDITIVVIFIYHDSMGKIEAVPEQSVRGFSDTVAPSKFSIFKG